MRLYEIADQYQSILDNAVDQETGEISESVLIRLDEVKSDIREKGIAVASYIKNLEADMKAIEAARKAMAEREAKIEREIEWLNDYLRSNMERCGISEISCPYFLVKLKKCPVSVNVMDETAIPEDYIRSKVVKTPDKAAMREALLAGAVIPGASLRQNTRIEIR